MKINNFIESYCMKNGLTVRERIDYPKYIFLVTIDKNNVIIPVAVEKHLIRKMKSV